MKAISTRYHGPTDTRGARITATDLDDDTVNMTYDASYSPEWNHQAAARLFCLGFKRHGTYAMGSLGQDYVFVCLDGAQTFEV